MPNSMKRSKIDRRDAEPAVTAYLTPGDTQQPLYFGEHSRFIEPARRKILIDAWMLYGNTTMRPSRVYYSGMPKLLHIENTLKLVYSPISSFYAADVIEDEDAKEALKSSNFYAIAIQPEIKFTSFDTDGDLLQIEVEGSTAEDHALKGSFDVDLNALANQDGNALELQRSGRELENYAIECDTRGTAFRLWADTRNEDGTAEAVLVWWATPSTLMYDVSRGVPGITASENWREFTHYELLYIGISKENDTYIRLFTGAHEARQRILNREYPRTSGARISDELLLFAFRAEQTTYTDITDDLAAQPEGPNLRDPSGSTQEDDEWWLKLDRVDEELDTRVIADAEKAFVHVLDPEYNNVKYKNYPEGLDGLSSVGLKGHSYVIGEDLTFHTAGQVMRGARHDRVRGVRSGKVDIIQIASGEIVDGPAR